MILIVFVTLFSLNILSIEARDKLDLQILSGCQISVPLNGYDRICKFEEGVRVTGTCKEGEQNRNLSLTTKNRTTESFNGSFNITLDEAYDGAVLTCFETEEFQFTLNPRPPFIKAKSDVLFEIIVKKVSDNHKNADHTRNASNSYTVGSVTGNVNSTLVVSASCAALVIVVIICYFIWQALKKCTSKRPHNESPHKDTIHPTSHTVRWIAKNKLKDCEEYAKVVDELDESERSMYSEPVTVPQYATPIPKCDRKKRKEESYENVINKHNKYANVNVPPASDYVAAYDVVNTGAYDLDGYCDIYL